MQRTDWREASRNHRPASEHQEGFTLRTEHLNAGSLMRIADAMEVMAKDRLQMERDLMYWKGRAEMLELTRKRLENTVRGMKGRITRLQKTQMSTT